MRDLWIFFVLLGLTVLAYFFPVFDYGTCYITDVISIFVERNSKPVYTAGWCYRYVGMVPYITLMILFVIGHFQMRRLRRIQEERARKK